jgi:hypothetical protein
MVSTVRGMLRKKIYKRAQVLAGIADKIGRTKQLTRSLQC